MWENNIQFYIYAILFGQDVLELKALMCKGYVQSMSVKGI